MEKAIKEIRTSELRAMEDEEMIIEGYAAVFDSPTNLGWCTETIDKNAFNNCNIQDVCLKYNHNDNLLILARTKNKSLKITIDDKGLKIRASLVDTTQNIDIYKAIRCGLLDKMSFAFSVRKQEWDYEKDTRKILEIDQLFDVSIVDVPAYESTEVYARSKNKYEEEKDNYNKLKIEKEKIKLMLSL